MRYVHDGKLLKTYQSIGVEKVDDNNYCFVYSYCSPKDHYSKKKAREVIDAKYNNALSKMDVTKDCSIVVHELNEQNIIDSIITTKPYLVTLIYNIYFPKGIFTALLRHSNIQPFTDMDLLGFESKELKQLALDLRKYAMANFF